ncbi:TIGR02391 family protein [Leucobacter komagatae]|uniref:DNA restriction-modification system protein n=1 Tax=Leucobacter komagatae TaxID=55969 RepID=A0A0D0IS44_9MICO|nr:TIGR02391 family protein [Leucobacter komagatae]KIP53807.1 DNA restriction-modification system protein [Leucobacter komagatae]
MSALDVEWAITSLREFVHATDQVAYDNRPGSGVVMLGTYQRVPDAKAAELAYVAEQILDRALPEWRVAEGKRGEAKGKARWKHLRDWAARGIAALEREAELQEKLGDAAPRVSAGDFHSWIWLGASSLWYSGHYREAVEGAIRKLNAETQNKLGRRDLSEDDLFKQAFSEQPPAPNSPRLHRMKDDSSKTFKSAQRGARSLAEGVFAGIRNPLAHESEVDMPEQQALEYLAALSVLARWVDESSLETAS